MGGEPLLRKDLPECSMKLREHGFRWGIVTNGFAYDEAMHSKLISAGMGSITVSLDGLEENHNWLRNNPKSFERAVKALELIVSYPRLNYDVVTCVHQKNLAELPALKEFLISEKIKNWRIFTIVPIGRAAENPEMLLSNEQTRQLMNFTAETRKNDPRINLYQLRKLYWRLRKKGTRQLFLLSCGRQHRLYADRRLHFRLPEH